LADEEVKEARDWEREDNLKLSHAGEEE